jgi:hypothetical protein
MLKTLAAAALAVLAFPTAHAALIVQPISVVTTGGTPATDGWWTVTNTYNGSGLSNASLVADGVTDPGNLGTNIAALPTHATAVYVHPTTFGRWSVDSLVAPANGVITGSGATARYTLSSTFDINGVYLWNYSETGGMDRALNQTTFRFFASDNTTLLSTQTVSFAQALAGPTFAPEFKSFSTVPGAQYVELTLDSNHGSTYATGYGEVRFTGVPEPSTWALLLAGSFTTLMALRRRRKA